jgi:spermidine synthase
VLNLIVFSCGACLMGLEIVAARVLAPALGNSIYVWGAVISVVMAALALGYWLGGQAADRWGPARILPAVIAGAAAATAAAPLVAQAILPWLADLGPRIGSLVGASLIFFAPALLLAMVSPLGVRMAAARGMSHVGRSAGGLYAVSTSGSIFGTLLTAFWLIPLLSIEPLIVATALVLAMTAFAALTLPLSYPASVSAETQPTAGNVSARMRPTTIWTVALVGLGAIIGAYVLVEIAPPPGTNSYGETVLYQEDSQYHRISVTEDDAGRHLRFDKSHQSAVSLNDPYESLIRYPDYFHLALAVRPEPESVLILGLGGGATTKRMWRDYDDIHVDTVEIDPAVVDVARTYFDLPEDERSRVFVEDARRYVQRTDETYDLIIIDAYYSDSLPYHLTTEEFLTEVDARLEPGGVVAYNVISSAEGEGSELFRSMYRTAGEVWGNVWVFPIGIGSEGAAEDRRNIIVLASDTDLPDEELLDAIASRVDGAVTIAGFEAMGDDLYTEMVPMADVPVLTDSHAPTDSLIKVQ